MLYNQSTIMLYWMVVGCAFIRPKSELPLFHHLCMVLYSLLCRHLFHPLSCQPFYFPKLHPCPWSVFIKPNANLQSKPGPCAPIPARRWPRGRGQPCINNQWRVTAWPHPERSAGWFARFGRWGSDGEPAALLASPSLSPSVEAAAAGRPRLTDERWSASFCLFFSFLLLPTWMYYIFSTLLVAIDFCFIWECPI